MNQLLISSLLVRNFVRRNLTKTERLVSAKKRLAINMNGYKSYYEDIAWTSLLRLTRPLSAFSDVLTASLVAKNDQTAPETLCVSVKGVIALDELLPLGYM